MNAIEIFFNLDVLRRAFPMLLQGLGMTLILGFSTILFGTLLGLGIALVRLFAVRPLQLLAILYTDLMRAMPVLVVLILIYYALPFAGIVLSSFTAALIALSLVLGAYTAEVMRAGIQAVPKGQFEAASALGLGFWRTMQKVILPQATRLVIPPHASNCVSIIKDTSLASVVTMTDLLKQATDAQALFANPTPLLGAALIYVAILWPLVRLTGWLEHRFQRAYQRLYPCKTPISFTIPSASIPARRPTWPAPWPTSPPSGARPTTRNGAGCWPGARPSSTAGAAS